MHKQMTTTIDNWGERKEKWEGGKNRNERKPKLQVEMCVESENTWRETEIRKRLIWKEACKMVAKR